MFRHSFHHLPLHTLTADIAILIEAIIVKQGSERVVVRPQPLLVLVLIDNVSHTLCVELATSLLDWGILVRLPRQLVIGCRPR
jgi:hypothetical protein